MDLFLIRTIQLGNASITTQESFEIYYGKIESIEASGRRYDFQGMGVQGHTSELSE